jgi:hypothetical protein
LRVAALLLKEASDDYEIVGFHAQQVEFPKTHNITVLRQFVAHVDQALADRLAPADALTPYGVEFRYPGDLPALSRDQGARAVLVAEQTRDLVLAHLKPYLDAGRPSGNGPTKR